MAQAKLETWKSEEDGRWRARFRLKTGGCYVASGDTEEEALSALRKMLADRAAALRGDDDE